MANGDKYRIIIKIVRYAGEWKNNVEDGAGIYYY